MQLALTESAAGRGGARRRRGWHLANAGALLMLTALLALLAGASPASAQSDASAQSESAGPGTAPERAKPLGTRIASARLVEASLLSSPLHTLAPEAVVRGHLAVFTLRTPYGPIKAEGVEMLEVRVQELLVLDELQRISSAGIYLRAIGAQSMRTLRSVGHVLLHPVDTVTGIPQGVVRFFQRKLGDGIDDAVELSDEVRHTAGDEDERFADAVRPGARVQRDDLETGQQRTQRRARKIALNYIGYDDARRYWAKRLGIDPYSSNPLIKSRLDRLAWSAFAGDKTVGFALDSLTAGASEALSITRKLNEVVWELEPVKLGRLNYQRLESIGCGGMPARRLVNRGRYSPTQQTALVDALEQLRPAQGCSEVLRLAAALESEVETRYIVNALRLMQHFHANSGGNRKIRLVGTGLMLETSDSEWVLPLPVDYLMWTSATRGYFDQQAFRKVRKTLLVSGKASPTAMRELTQRGWSIVLDVPYAGAPPYASGALAGY